MRIMGAHKMLQLGASVAGTVDGDTYDPDALCDGDPHNPVRTPDGTVNFTVTALAALSGINGLVLVNTNLAAGIVVTFSGLGTVTTLTVPENDIRLNPYELLDPAAGSVSGFTLTASAGIAAVIGDAIAGIFEEIFPIGPGPSSPFEEFGIPHAGEFRGLAYSKGGEARGFGGTGLITGDEKAILDACWRASRDNSRPTVIIPYDWSDDAWVVLWDSYEVKPYDETFWELSVSWREPPRLRWPA